MFKYAFYSFSVGWAELQAWLLRIETLSQIMQKLMLLLLTLVLLVLQVQLWTGKGSVAEMVATQRQIEEQQRENERLYSRNRLLAVEVVELQNGLITLEEYARLDLGMVSSDETYYLIYD